MNLNRHTKILQYLQRNKVRFREDLGIIEIGLIGSVARGEANPESDVDLIVEFAPGTQRFSIRKPGFAPSLKRHLAGLWIWFENAF